MSLTIGTGPLAPGRAGAFNGRLELPEPLLLFDPYLPRVRAVFEGEVVVDSTATMLLHESGRLPVFYFPREDVRTDLLERSGRQEELPGKGRASWYTLRCGSRAAADAAFGFDQPEPAAAFLAGHLAFQWGAIDEWFTEDEQVFGHPRDPYSRIEALKSARHVRVSLRGQLLAETRRSTILYETALPPRFYIPPADVRTELLVASPNRTRCAYKGSASYWHVRLGERLVEDLVWTYRDPLHDAEQVADLLCFFNERSEIELDGELLERPTTQWSRDDEDEPAGAQALRGLTGRR
ncbi:MAG TPA: DUF427 domain-containing protein [Thermoleophilaceae bacterium]|nr:DUF427 domain-containing protein [Thermoleophilaceae bacterium]